MNLKTVLVALLCLCLAGILLGLQKAELPDDMDDFKHINTLVVPDKESPIHGIHHFYLNKKGMNTFHSMAEGKTYPDGTIFIGKVFKVVETEQGRLKEGDMAAVTYMRKQIDSEETKNTGGWHFVMFTPDGTPKDIDPQKACFQCHKPFEKSDFVISQPLK